MIVLGGLDEDDDVDDDAEDEESGADALPGRKVRDANGCWSRSLSSSRGRLWSMSPETSG